MSWKRKTDCEPLLKVVDEHFKTDERTNATVKDMLTHMGR